MWALFLGSFGGAAVASDRGDSTALVVVLEVGDEVVFGSQRTDDALVRELARRGFAATPLDGAELIDGSGGRSSADRLEAARRLGGSSTVVLVETEAAFYGQVAGRYRWTVTAHVTVASHDAGDEPLSRVVEVPVFLVYDHEREAEALAESSVMLARRVGSVCRDYRDGAR